ncbi:hypothetical protein HYU14_01520 [Candidatus Woesearchaeota archaeon]|nr:hypothetical protein [Candidatus Woesearchaeota archaeon]
MSDDKIARIASDGAKDLLEGRFDRSRFINGFVAELPVYRRAQTNLQELYQEQRGLEATLAALAMIPVFLDRSYDEQRRNLAEGLNRAVGEPPHYGKRADRLEFMLRYAEHLIGCSFAGSPFADIALLSQRIAETYGDKLVNDRQIEELTRTEERWHSFYEAFKQNEVVELVGRELGGHFASLVDDCARLSSTGQLLRFVEISKPGKNIGTNDDVLRVLTHKFGSVTGEEILAESEPRYEDVRQSIRGLSQQYPPFDSWGQDDHTTLAHAVLLFSQMPEEGLLGQIRKSGLELLRDGKKGFVFSSYGHLGITVAERVTSPQESFLLPFALGGSLGNLTIAHYGGHAQSVHEYIEKPPICLRDFYSPILTGAGQMWHNPIKMEEAAAQLHDPESAFSMRVGELGSIFKSGITLQIDLCLTSLGMKYAAQQSVEISGAESERVA